MDERRRAVVPACSLQITLKYSAHLQKLTRRVLVNESQCCEFVPGFREIRQRADHDYERRRVWERVFIGSWAAATVSAASYQFAKRRGL